MISSADLDIVRRDPGLPGLATLLDPDPFVAALRASLPEVDLGRNMNAPTRLWDTTVVR